MEFETKAWGYKEVFARTESLLIARLTVKEGGMCSRHYHKQKLNEFVVEEGNLLIATGDYLDNFVVSLVPGDRMVIDPSVVHQFKAIVPTVVWEIESCHGIPSVSDADIIRLQGNLEFSA